MTHFRIRYETRGKHTHMRLFTSTTGAEGTWQLAGRLVLRNPEFEDFHLLFLGIATVSFLPEEWEKVRQHEPIEEKRNA